MVKLTDFMPAAGVTFSTDVSWVRNTNFYALNKTMVHVLGGHNIALHKKLLSSQPTVNIHAL